RPVAAGDRAGCRARQPHVPGRDPRPAGRPRRRAGPPRAPRGAAPPHPAGHDRLELPAPGGRGAAGVSQPRGVRGRLRRRRAALERAVISDPCAGLRVLGGSRDLFFRFGQADGLRLAQALLARCVARDRARIVGLITVGQLAAVAMELDAARIALAEAAGLSAGLGEPGLSAWTSFFRGITEVYGGELEAA